MENQHIAVEEKWIQNEGGKRGNQKPCLKDSGDRHSDLPFRTVQRNKGHVLEHDSKTTETSPPFPASDAHCLQPFCTG